MHIHAIETRGVLHGRYGRGHCIEGFDRLRTPAIGGLKPARFRLGEPVDWGVEYPDAAGSQAVEWESAAAPRALRAGALTLVWTCALGGTHGGSFGHRLYLNGRPVCRLETPIGATREWRGAGGCRVRFDALDGAPNGEWQGIMYLRAPAAWFVPGRRAVLRVQGECAVERNYSFFMLACYRDTLRRARTLAQGAVDLVVAGRPRAEIVIAPGSGAVARFAADELQCTLRRMSGARLPIRIGAPRNRSAVLLGTRAAVRSLPGLTPPVCRAGRGREAIRLATWNGCLVLTGSTPSSVLLAVYQWLTAQGCRWIEPGAHGERVPARRTVRAGVIDWSYTPAYRFRITRPTEDVYVYTEQDVRDQIAWLARNGLNRIHFLIPPYERLRRVIVREMRRRGLEISVGDHPFRSWLPRSLFARHPDYFAWVNGRRIPVGSARCASSKAGLRTWARNAVAWVRAHPEVDEIRISSDDGATYCQCPGCRKLKPIDQLQIFYTRAARAIHRRYPSTRVLFFSYTGFYEPSRIVPAYTRNASVMVDLFARCPVHPLATGRCPRDNKQYVYSARDSDVRAAEINRYLCLALGAWRRTMGAVSVFENVMKHALLDTPFPYPRVLAEDVRYLYDIGVSGFAAQADLTRWTHGALNHIVLARLLWDPNADVETVLSDYYSRTYGPAAGSVRAYEQRVEEALARAHYGSLLNGLTPALAAACRRDLAAAASRARRAPYRGAVERIAVLFEYTERLWTLERLRADILAALETGQLAAARRARRAAVTHGRALLALGRRYRHRNIFFFGAGVAARADRCMNDYPFVRRRARLPEWVRRGTFGDDGSIRNVCADRRRCQGGGAAGSGRA